MAEGDIEKHENTDIEEVVVLPDEGNVELNEITSADVEEIEAAANSAGKEYSEAQDGRYKKELLREIMLACAGVAIGTAVMFVIMVLCMSFSMPLLWGSLLGMATAALYWILLYISKTTVIKIPYIGRMAILIILVIIGLKFDCFYNWAVLIPLAFTKPLAYIFLFIESRKN